MDSSNTSTTTSTIDKHSLSYDTFRDGYKEYNKKILLQSKTDEWKTTHKREWSHKQLCLQHKLYPELIQKYFTNTEMPSSLFKICQCGIIKQKVKSEYQPILRLALDKALAQGTWKMKTAYFTDLNIKITDPSLPNNTYIHNTIQMIKIKIGAVKRYTQPKTNKEIFGAATFYKKSVFWQLDSQNKYILEMRLKSRECRQKLPVNASQTAKDVATWWYQCWGLHGIREEHKDNNIKLRQFFAIHDNTFVHKTSLHHSIQRVSLWLHKQKTNESIITATINTIPMIDIDYIKTYLNNLSQNSSQNLSQNSSQATPRSQTPSCKLYENENTNTNNKMSMSSIGINDMKYESWNFSNISDNDKDKLIEKLKNELKEKDKTIKRLEQQNQDLTVSLSKLNREFVPLSGELRFSQDDKNECNVSNEPPLKKRRLNE
eukprot:94439_1